MSHANPDPGRRAEADRLLQEIADYALDARIERAEAWETAHYCLLDALGCGGHLGSARAEPGSSLPAAR